MRGPEPAQGSASTRARHLPVVIAVLSLVVATLSYKQSCNSGKLADMSLRISQRAYLHLANGVVEVDGLPSASEIAGMMKRLADDYPNPMLIGGLNVRIAFDLENSGNTPAEVSDAEVEFDNHDGWIMVDYVRSGSTPGSQMGVTKVKLPALGTVAPKSVIRREYLYEVKATPDAAVTFFSPLTTRMVTPRGVEGPIRLKGRIAYRDTFNEVRELTWCWVHNLNTRSALECDEVRELRGAPAGKGPQ